MHSSASKSLIEDETWAEPVSKDGILHGGSGYGMGIYSWNNLCSGDRELADLTPRDDFKSYTPGVALPSKVRPYLFMRNASQPEGAENNVNRNRRLSF